MGLNLVTLNGRLPRFEGTYIKGEGEKKSFLSWCISVKRSYKRPDEQYYPEDLLRFKAFGPKADAIMNNFTQGDGLILVGNLQVEDDYEKDGQTVKGQMVIMVDSVSFADGRIANPNGNGGAKSAPTVPGGKATPTIPGAKAPTIPGGAKAPTIPTAKTNFGNRPPVPTFKR